MRSFVRAAVRIPLAGLRAGSKRLVLMTPGNVGFGNILYLLLQAHRMRGHSQLQHVVLTTPALEPWLEVFPELQTLVIGPEELRFLDGRRHGWFQGFYYHGRASVESFVSEMLLPGLAAHREPREGAKITINVRRGDYYSVPEFRARYGFDIASYVKEATAGSLRQGGTECLNVVSDDPQWCRQHLAFLSDIAAVDWQASTDGPVDNFLDLASSRRLILANSSFSYWSAYVSNVLYGNNHEWTWAPAFHSRGPELGPAIQLDPRWSIVRELREGWEEPGQAQSHP